MKKSHESAEDYLETILILRERNGNVRSIDIVNEMNYSKPSISIAMKKLKAEGLVEMDLNGYITLTGPGEEIAQRIYSRHRLLEKFLTAIGVDPETAAEEACRIRMQANIPLPACLHSPKVHITGCSGQGSIPPY